MLTRDWLQVIKGEQRDNKRILDTQGKRKSRTFRKQQVWRCFNMRYLYAQILRSYGHIFISVAGQDISL